MASIPRQSTAKSSLFQGHPSHPSAIQDYDGSQTDLLTTSVYLRPYIDFSGLITNPPLKLLLSDIANLKEMTIHGCKQIYERIPFATRIDCTPSAEAEKVQVEYFLDDGTSIIRQRVFE